ncbi:hypothetical protein ACJJIP_07505 [Microbulbifer sp. VTAC004]|uniref:hypothetical protein n=1 Tax=Microbulbifer sp. VTAC004 TaxID=3243386 RepID=UPI004039BE3F
MLDIENIKEEWNKYLDARDTGIKHVWKPLLSKQLEEIKSLNKEDLNDYLLEICKLHFDVGLNIPVEHPNIWPQILELWKCKLDNPDEKIFLWLFKAKLYKDAYLLCSGEPKELLESALTINPESKEAKKLLFIENLDLLDFAMHSLPCGLHLEVDTCKSAISECEQMLVKNPELKIYKTRFNIGFSHYKEMFFAWLEYQEKGIKLEFFDWYKPTET